MLAACLEGYKLSSTQGFEDRVFSHLKLLLRENRARIGNDITDAIVFIKTNKVA